MPRFMTIIEPWINDEIEKQAPGEGVNWEATIGPTEAGPMMAIMMFMPGAVLGTWVSTAINVNNVFAMQEENAADVVRTLLDGCRSERTKQLAGTN